MTELTECINWIDELEAEMVEEDLRNQVLREQDEIRANLQSASVFRPFFIEASQVITDLSAGNLSFLFNMGQLHGLLFLPYSGDVNPEPYIQAFDIPESNPEVPFIIYLLLTQNGPYIGKTKGDNVVFRFEHHLSGSSSSDHPFEALFILECGKGDSTEAEYSWMQNWVDRYGKKSLPLNRKGTGKRARDTIKHLQSHLTESQNKANTAFRQKRMEEIIQIISDISISHLI